MTAMNQREKPELFLTENTECFLSSPGSSLRSWQTQDGLVNSQTLSVCPSLKPVCENTQA